MGIQSTAMATATATATGISISQLLPLLLAASPRSSLGTSWPGGKSLCPARLHRRRHRPRIASDWCAFSVIGLRRRPPPRFSAETSARGAIPPSISADLPATAAGGRSGRAGALFPSDDSDYELRTERGGGAVAGTPSSLPSSFELENIDAMAVDRGVPPASGSNPTSSQIQLEDPSFVDPIDAIADWVSYQFVEHSLQHRSYESDNGGDGGPESGYVMESYSPGSALDSIARASSTYVPLSYQVQTLVRVMLPSLLVAMAATAVYPSVVQWIVHLPSSLAEDMSTDAVSILYNDRVLTVLSNDLSQYVQNILTTCALLFGMLVGQTYYFMYQQQELVFYALFAEVTEAKSLLEQISLVTGGRDGLYPSLLSRMDDYVQNDLKLLSIRDPIALTSRQPRDDPLESIMYATSVGLPGAVYETVKSLRQARADRCGALQRKLPTLHVYCLRLLGVIVLSTFPVCGSGSQAIAPNVLVLQGYMFGILAFALTLVLNVVEELRDARKMGAYNVDGVLEVMVGGLERELEERLEGKFCGVGVSPMLPARASVSTLASTTESKDCAVTPERGPGGEDVGLMGEPPSRGTRIRDWLRRRVLSRQ